VRWWPAHRRQRNDKEIPAELFNAACPYRHGFLAGWAQSFKFAVGEDATRLSSRNLSASSTLTRETRQSAITPL
jgi:hypothetical protein